MSTLPTSFQSAIGQAEQAMAIRRRHRCLLNKHAVRQFLRHDQDPELAALFDAEVDAKRSVGAHHFTLYRP